MVEPRRRWSPEGGGEDVAGDGPSQRWHLLHQAQLLPPLSSTASHDEGCVADRHQAGAVSVAAVDPVFVHGGEQLQDVPLLEAQVTVSSARVVTQRPDCPAQQTLAGI